MSSSPPSEPAGNPADLHYQDRMALVERIQELRRAYHDALVRASAAQQEALPSLERMKELRVLVPKAKAAAASAKDAATLAHAASVVAGQEARRLRTEAYNLECELHGRGLGAVATEGQAAARLEIERITDEWFTLCNTAIEAGVMPAAARGKLPTKPQG